MRDGSQLSPERLAVIDGGEGLHRRPVVVGHLGRVHLVRETHALGVVDVEDRVPSGGEVLIPGVDDVLADGAGTSRRTARCFEPVKPMMVSTPSSRGDRGHLHLFRRALAHPFAVCDNPIDFRHQAIVGPKVWGDGDGEGVRQRAAEAMKKTAIAARKLGVDTVVGFTGSSIWQYVAMFPPVGQDVIDAGYQDFADRWNPILDVYDAEGVRFAHEVHPSEIAYDYWTTKFTLDAIDHREAFGLNWDPSHMVWQGIDPVASSWSSRTGSITWTARTRACGWARRRDPRLPPAVVRPPARLGLRLDRTR